MGNPKETFQKWRWKLTNSSHLRKLWIALLILLILCAIIQIVERFHYTSNCRCEFRQKQPDFQESSANENSFQLQMKPSSTPLHSEHEQKSTSQNRETPLWLWSSTVEKNQHAMRPSKVFDKTKLLDASLGSEEIWQKTFLKGTERVQILHETSQQKDQKNPNNRIIPGTDQEVGAFADNINDVGINNGNSLIQETDPITRITADDQNSRDLEPWRSHASKSTRTTLQVFDAIKDKRPIEMALAKAAKKPTQPEKTAFPKDQGTAGVSSPNLSQLATCKPKTHIVFLKVHKSASSTVMNILFRFGETHNLTFAMPINGASQLFYPYYFTAAAVEGFVAGKDSQFDILCHHMRFLQPEVAKVMSNTSFYFAILRNPVHLMESSFTYYKGTSSFAKTKSLEDFLNKTSLFYKASANDSQYAKNLMTFDFGYNHNGNFSANQVQLMLRAIEAEFDLLLISEYFDESMVLLKKLLCWDLDDVVSFPLNSRQKSSKNHLSEKTIEQIKSWNKLDWELYVHFNRTFWEKIHFHIGWEFIQQEVKALQQRRKQLAEICLEEGDSVAPKMIKDKALAPLQYGNAKILGYNLKDGLDNTTRQMCQSLVTPELQYSKLLYRKQFPKKALKLSNSARVSNLNNRRTV